MIILIDYFFWYETEFFHNVVHGRDIISWEAVDRNRPNGQSDELIGFPTARVVMAKESELSFMYAFLDQVVVRDFIYPECKIYCNTWCGCNVFIDCNLVGWRFTQVWLIKIRPHTGLYLDSGSGSILQKFWHRWGLASLMTCIVYT